MLSIYGDIPELRKFEIKQLIGKGCFGQVRKAFNKETRQQVALKFIEKKSRKNSELVKEKQEFYLLKRMTENEYIITGYSLIESRDWVVIQAQLADGDLATYQSKQRNGRLEESEIRRMAKQMIIALKQMHNNKIVHRDLKPQNIFMKGKDIRLGDFGFAKDLQSKDFFTSIKGTPLYIAPQMISGKNISKFSPKVDIWAFGIILFEMATGKPPFYEQRMNLLFTKIQKQQFKCPSYMSTSLKSLIQQILKSPEELRPSWNQIEKHQFFSKGVQQINESKSQTKLIHNNIGNKDNRENSIDSIIRKNTKTKKNNIYTYLDKLATRKNLARQRNHHKIDQDYSRNEIRKMNFYSPQQTVRMPGKCYKNASPPKQINTNRMLNQENIHKNTFKEDLLKQGQCFRGERQFAGPLALPDYVNEIAPRASNRENSNQRRLPVKSPYQFTENPQPKALHKNNGAVKAIEEIEKQFSDQNRQYYTRQLQKNHSFYSCVRQVLSYASIQKQQSIPQSDYQLTRIRSVKNKVPQKTLIFVLQLLQSIYCKAHNKKMSRINNPQQQYENLFSQNQEFLQDLVTLSLKYQDSAEVLAQLYKTLIGALRSNFDGVQVDLKVAQNIIQNLTQRNFYCNFQSYKQPGKIRQNSGNIRDMVKQNHCQMNQILNNCLITIGVLTNQAILTLEGPSDQFFALLNQFKCLEKVCSLFNSQQRMHRTILQLLLKVLNPNLQGLNKNYNIKHVKNPQLSNQTINNFQKLRLNIAISLQKVGLIGIQSPVQVYGNYLDIQIYMKVLYQCMKHQQCKQIRRNFMIHKNYWIQISKKYPRLLLLVLAQNHYLMKYENESIIENQLKQILKAEQNPMIQVFSPGYFYFQTCKNFRLSNQKNRQKFEQKIKRLLQIIKQDYLKQDGSLPNALKNKDLISVIMNSMSDSDQVPQNQQLDQNIESKILCNYHPYYDILIDLLCRIIIENRNATEIARDGFQLVIQNLKIHKRKINVSERTFQKILVCSDYSPDVKDLNNGIGKKFAEKIIQVFKMYMNQSLFKAYQQRQDLGIEFSRQIAFRMIKFIIRIIMLMPPQRTQKIYKIAEYAQKGDFLKYILTSHFIDNKEINIKLSLSFANKILSKCHNQTIRFLALRVPSLLIPFFGQFNDLTIQILTFFSIIAKQTQQNYESIAKSGIVEYLPKYINEMLGNQANNTQFRETQVILDKSLILIGNLSRYSIFFFRSFQRLGIMQLIVECFRKYYQNSSIINDNPEDQEFPLRLTRKQSRKIKQKAGTFKIKRSLLYAIGNMTFYDSMFHPQIIEFLPEMLSVIKNVKNADEFDLVNNAIATLINLIRISPRCLKQFLEHKVVQIVLDFATITFQRHSFQSASQLESTLNKFFEKVIKESYRYPEAYDTWFRIESYIKQRNQPHQRNKQFSETKRIKPSQSQERRRYQNKF